MANSPGVTTYKPVITGPTTATVSGEVYDDGTVPAFVQGTGTFNNVSGGAINVAFGSNVVAGNLLVIATGVTGPGLTMSISDTQGNSWSQANTSIDSANYQIFVHYAVAKSSAACTVTMTPSASGTFRRLLIHEYSGVDTFDVTSQAAAASGIPDSGPAETTRPGELIFGWGINENSSTVAGPSFNLRVTQNVECTEDLFVNRKGNYRVVYPTDATANCCIMATFYKASQVTERGIVYGTSTAPTTANTKVTTGSGLSLYTDSMTGLTPGTKYYVRAYAINSNGTSYGDEFNFTYVPGPEPWTAAYPKPADIIFDVASTSITNGFGAGTTVTWNHTTAAGNNRLMTLHAACWQDVAGTGIISAASYDGQPMTKIDQTSSTSMSSELWYLVAPATGTKVVSVTFSANRDALKFAAATWQNVHQGSPIDATSKTTGTTGNPSFAITTNFNQSMVVDVLSRFSTTAGTTQATSLANDATSSTLLGASYRIQDKAGPTFMTYVGPTANDWSMIIAALRNVGV